MSTELPYMRRRAQHKIGKAGRKSEKRLARELGAELRPASGALGDKGDMALAEFLLEAKSTTQASMALKFAWLVKIATEARQEGKIPALAVSYVDAQGASVIDGDWILVPKHTFLEAFPWLR